MCCSSGSSITAATSGSAAKPEFDAKLAATFTETHLAVAAGEAWRWRATPDGRLAEIIVLDQFSRQIHRGEARAFASDPMALALAQEAVAGGHDLGVPHERRMFFYLPYMHSESLVVHEEALRLFEALGIKENLDYELAHHECPPLRPLSAPQRRARPHLDLGGTRLLRSDEGKW